MGHAQSAIWRNWHPAPVWCIRRNQGRRIDAGLVVGTAAWLLVLAGLDGKPAQATRLVAFCARAEIVSLLLLGAATLAAASAVITGGWPPRTLAAAGLTLLGWLEYVNYYHWQLQNFDSQINARRLAAGRGLRRAHMGRAVRAWRARQRRN